MCNRRSNGGLNRTTGPEPWRDSDLHHADVFTEEEEKERMGKSARGPKRFHMHPGRTTRNETQARARQTTLVND